MKKIWLTLLLSLSLICLSVSISLADPSQLLIARTAAGALWTKTCTGTTCSAWGPISGVLAMDPTLIWDQDTAKYYLYGIVSSGQVWRSTFNADGTFNDDWVWSGGASSSPIIAAAGGRFQNFAASSNGSMTAVELTGTITNIKSTGFYAPSSGFALVTGSGTISQNRSSTSGNVFTRTYLTTTSGGTQTAWSFSELPNETPASFTSFPFVLSRWFGVTEGDYTYYLTGEEGGSAALTTTTNVYNALITAQFFPYSY